MSKLVKSLEKSATSSIDQLHEAKKALSAARSSYRKACNAATKFDCNARDTLVHSVLGSNPRSLFKAIKSRNSKSSLKIQALNVGDKVYSGTSVPDGFFDSLSSLKSPDMSSIHSSESYESTFSDYSTIRKICEAGLRIPEIAPKDATEILYNLKPDVNDLYSVTARHYVNAGV